MKTAILQCLQQVSSKNSKTVYYEKNYKKVQITVLMQNLNFLIIFFIINGFAIFTGNPLQTLQNSSFNKRCQCFLEAKTNVLHNFAMAL